MRVFAEFFKALPILKSNFVLPRAHTVYFTFGIVLLVVKLIALYFGKHIGYFSALFIGRSVLLSDLVVFFGVGHIE